MSTTDRFEVLRRACSCGKGEYVVNHCSPDHPWARAHQNWWEATIECSHCSMEFVLVDQDGVIVRVRKTDVAAKKATNEKWHTKIREIEAHCEGQGYYQALALWVSSRGSVAATFRALSGVVSTVSEGTFRKRFSPTKEWVKREIHYSNVPKALKKIDQADPVLEQLINEAEIIWKAAQADLPVVEILYKEK